MRTRLAFTLVEVLTALVLLAVGLAASTRAALGVARLENDARARRMVAAIVRARLDSLSASPCPADRQSGDTLRNGIREQWEASPAGSHVELILDLQVVIRPSLSRTYAVSVPCQP
jgi:prepilin-type N-terminal cleavage/methylation domain-containing protein